MNNLSNTAKKLDKVFEIVYIVLGALAIACLVFIALIGVAYLLKLDPDMIGTGFGSFEVGFLKLEIAEAFSPDKWMVLLQAAITLAISCRLLYDARRGVGYIRQILHPMTEEKPFDSIIGTNLKKLAKLSINLGILYNIILLVEQIMTIYVYDLPGLMLSEKITHVTEMFHVDLSFLIYWAILTLLSYVFRYGEQLQQLSDETL